MFKKSPASGPCNSPAPGPACHTPAGESGRSPSPRNRAMRPGVRLAIWPPAFRCSPSSSSSQVVKPQPPTPHPRIAPSGSSPAHKPCGNRPPPPPRSPGISSSPPTPNSNSSSNSPKEACPSSPSRSHRDPGRSTSPPRSAPTPAGATHPPDPPGLSSPAISPACPPPQGGPLPRPAPTDCASPTPTAARSSMSTSPPNRSPHLDRPPHYPRSLPDHPLARSRARPTPLRR
jgi:hypothetical protein